MEIQYDRIIIYPADIGRWYGLDRRAAYRRYREIKIQLGIPPKRPLTIFHYSDYSGSPLIQLQRMLFPYLAQVFSFWLLVPN